MASTSSEDRDSGATQTYGHALYFLPLPTGETLWIHACAIEWFDVTQFIRMDIPARLALGADVHEFL